MIYKIDFTEQAQQEIAHLKKSNHLSYNKLCKLLMELTEHPETGTGKPHPMKYDFSGLWSRRIDHKNRLIYSINHNTVTVIKALGHYNDK